MNYLKLIQCYYNKATGYCCESGTFSSQPFMELFEKIHKGEGMIFRENINPWLSKIELTL